jgi:hypothetical protein
MKAVLFTTLKNSDKHDLKNEVTCGAGTLLATRGQ